MYATIKFWLEYCYSYTEKLYSSKSYHLVLWLLKAYYYYSWLLCSSDHSISYTQDTKIEEKSRAGSQEKLSNKSSSDGKLIQVDIPTLHLWSQVVTT